MEFSNAYLRTVKTENCLDLKSVETPEVDNKAILNNDDIKCNPLLPSECSADKQQDEKPSPDENKLPIQRREKV